MAAPEIGLDFETYGDVDLPTHGLDRYLNGEFFRPTLASTYRVEDGRVIRTRHDFVQDYESAKRSLLDELSGLHIVAHNAPFEQGVLKWMGVDLPHSRFTDSAVVARVAGAGSSLEAAAPQLLGVDKLESGKDLIKLFAIPGKYQEANGTLEFDPDIVVAHPVEWDTFGDYCDLDAELGYHISQRYGHLLGREEHEYTAITSDMNDVGWTVDMDKVEEMQRRYLLNQQAALAEFYRQYQSTVPPDDQLNFNSFPQLKKFCEERKVRAKSFNEEAVNKLLPKIHARLTQGGLTWEQERNLTEVRDMLDTKQILGGSSLSKLQKIKDLVGPGDRLRNSYLHVGAAATLRTTGRGVQMQNLKRLTTPADMSELDDPDSDWSNDDLAVNLRQVFTASHPDGQLIVGDFSSVESRGLAWIAGADWKVDAFRAGKDLYKVQATKIYPVSYDDVTKVMRQTGKVGELSCGYGAGPGAVKDFASGMGVTLTAEEAADIVTGWREANPEVVALWEILGRLLDEVVRQGQQRSGQIIGNSLIVTFRKMVTPGSLVALNPHAQSVQMQLQLGDKIIVSRIFHGCYLRGKDICYYKPASRKTGDLWVNHYRHPKTKQIVFFKLYGGKLSGILTQSMCREMFFHSLKQLHHGLRKWINVQIVGQFHDEIVLDWRPPREEDGLNWINLPNAESVLEQYMSTPLLPGFPLAAEIKHDYRYTK